ncbi:hypothetical protein DQ04_21171000, partial [Trypanosoma grayi]|uniref:hypothetical protein n=1 Tax=Trypanosoma grayi TaxID=71804 RepID=UPI0004F3F092
FHRTDAASERRKQKRGRDRVPKLSLLRAPGSPFDQARGHSAGAENGPLSFLRRLWFFFAFIFPTFFDGHARQQDNPRPGLQDCAPPRADSYRMAFGWFPKPRFWHSGFEYVVKNGVFGAMQLPPAPPPKKKGVAVTKGGCNPRWSFLSGSVLLTKPRFCLSVYPVCFM